MREIPLEWANIFSMKQEQNLDMIATDYSLSKNTPRYFDVKRWRGIGSHRPRWLLHSVKPTMKAELQRLEAHENAESVWQNNSVAQMEQYDYAETIGSSYNQIMNGNQHLLQTLKDIFSKHHECKYLENLNWLKHIHKRHKRLDIQSSFSARDNSFADGLGSLLGNSIGKHRCIFFMSSQPRECHCTCWRFFIISE